MTKLLQATAEGIKVAAEILRSGGVVGFPTETVYGLGANALSDDAVQKIFAAKQRPTDNPLIVHIANINEAATLVYEIPETVEFLMKTFWPGPLSIVLRARPQISKYATAGLDTVALRFPAHDVAQQLITAAGIPIAAPSANLSGKPSGTLAKHVWRDFDGRIDAVLDGGACEFGLESTVLDGTSNPIRLLRPGSITYEMLAAHVPIEIAERKPNDRPLSPGTKHPHYKPKAEVILVTGDKFTLMREKIVALTRQYDCAVFGLIEVVSGLQTNKVTKLAAYQSLEDLGENLYSFFRECDEEGIKYIILHEVPQSGLGLALMNRMQKAANIIC